MDSLFIALLALLGSSAVAAFLTSRWQLTKHNLDVLHVTYSRVAECHSRLRLAVRGVAGVLGVHTRAGFVWNYQKSEVVENLFAARAAQAELDGACLVHLTVNPDALNEIDRLRNRAEQMVDFFAPLKFTPRENDDAETGIMIEVRDQDPSAVLQDVNDGMQAMANDALQMAAVVTRQYHNQRGHIWRPLWVFVAALAIVLAIRWWLVTPSPWTFQVAGDTPVWVNSSTQEVRAVRLDEQSRNSQPEPADAESSPPTKR